MSKVIPTVEKDETEENWECSLPEEKTGTISSFETNKRVTISVLPNKETPLHEKFNEFLIEAIDEAFSSLGEPVKNTVYHHLENDFNIPKNEIPQKLDEFSHIIHKIFGMGASRLEIKFMKNLNSKVKGNVQMPEYEWPLSKWIVSEMSFKEYVNNIRKEYETQKPSTH